jgi:hypothetical protein
MTYRRAATALGSMLLLAACGGDSGGEATACAVFDTALGVADRMGQAATVFAVGEPITFALRVTNTRNAPATLTAGSSCTAVVFEIEDAAQRRRWGSADSIACIQMLQPYTFAPLEVVTWSDTWSQADSTGAPVAPGDFRVTASVGQYVTGTQDLVDCRAALSRSSPFAIR